MAPPICLDSPWHVGTTKTAFLRSEKVARNVEVYERTGENEYPSCPKRQKRPNISKFRTECTGKFNAVSDFVQDEHTGAGETKYL